MPGGGLWKQLGVLIVVLAVPVGARASDPPSAAGPRAAPSNGATHEEKNEPGAIRGAEPAARGRSQRRGPSQRAFSGSALRLESGSPDALCPDLARTRAAVRRRLGAIRSEALEGWLARYTLGHDAEVEPRDFVRLELFAPSGQRELSRDLPIEGSCATLSDAIALILDRHFRGLSATGAPPAQPRPPAGKGSAELEVVGSRGRQEEAGRQTNDSRQTNAPVETSVRAAQEPTPGSVWLGLEGSVDPSRGAWAAGVRCLGRWSSGFRLGLALSGRLGTRTEELGEAPRARVEASELELELLAGWSARLGQAHWLVAPVATAGVDFAKGVGLARAASGRRSRIGLGARSGVEWSWTADASISSLISVGWSATAWAGELHVDERPVLEPARHRFSIALATGYAW